MLDVASQKGLFLCVCALVFFNFYSRLFSKQKQLTVKSPYLGYIVLYTIQIISMQLYGDKQKKIISDANKIQLCCKAA